MAKRKQTAEEIINKLREAEVIIATGSRLQRPPGASGYRGRPATGGGPSTAVFGWTRPGA